MPASAPPPCQLRIQSLPAPVPSPHSDSITLEPARDVRGVGHFGTGDLEVTIQSMMDFEKAKPLLDAAYQNG